MMANNTINHVKDDAQYVKFNPTGNWPTNIKNVQAALAAIQGFAISGLPAATETVSGIAAIATQEEVNAGTVDNKLDILSIVFYVVNSIVCHHSHLTRYV